MFDSPFCKEGRKKKMKRRKRATFATSVYENVNKYVNYVCIYICMCVCAAAFEFIGSTNHLRRC